MTGFSHGTAGAGYALLELFEATDDSKYLIAAEQAFRYERHWFDVAARNWPDLREEPAKGSRVRRPLSFTTSWCHGAPGIALSRLRAYELCNREEYRAEALTAIKTTREAVMVSLRSGVGNFSLCHGLTGNAEVLLHGCRVLGQKGVDESALALAVADLGIDTYADRGL